MFSIFDLVEVLKNYSQLVIMHGNFEDFMRKNIVIALLTLMIFAGFKAKSTLSDLTPAEAVLLWNASLTLGDVETAKNLTAESYSGDIDALSKQYQKGLGIKDVKTTTIHSEIKGKRAIVIYRNEYLKSKQIKYWVDTLFLEGKIWKVAPQYVKDVKLTK
jgi:hypothetical protein